MSAAAAAWEHVGAFSWWRDAAALPAVGALADLAELESAIREAREAIVRDLRSSGWSWGEVGDALGVSRQAARQRYGGAGIR